MYWQPCIPVASTMFMLSWTRWNCRFSTGLRSLTSIFWLALGHALFVDADAISGLPTLWNFQMAIAESEYTLLRNSKDIAWGAITMPGRDTRQRKSSQLAN